MTIVEVLRLLIIGGQLKGISEKISRLYTLGLISESEREDLLTAIELQDTQNILGV